MTVIGSRCTDEHGVLFLESFSLSCISLLCFSFGKHASQSTNCTCVLGQRTHTISAFFHEEKYIFLRGGYNISKRKMLHLQFTINLVKRGRKMHLKNIINEEVKICQCTYFLTDRSKETDYIVSLVQSTSGPVFSLASLWWIRKECLVRFLLSLWCFQVIVHTSHPFTLVAPSGMSLTILSA